ncbi:MAG: helix-turn-helix domain-containing protein [Flavobacterium sp.]|nr:MAG: helix-turn-helix domain-containing protein [Flavobacterium sp.]
MPNTIRTLIILLALLPGWQAQPQSPAPDSLSKKTYSYFISKLASDETDSLDGLAYSAAFLSKAKREHNPAMIAEAYKSILHQSEGPQKMIYADSMVAAALQTKDNAAIGAAYLTKGVVYYNARKYIKALDNYIIADNYISRTDDDYQQHKVKFNIAQIKYYLGYYDEAISLLRDCVTYFKAEDDRAYLSSLHSLGLCYNRTGRFEQCNSINILGIADAKRLGIPQAIAHFTHSEGINQYSTGNFESAIAKLQVALTGLEGSGDFANQGAAWFYIGKSYWALGKPDMAVPYFIKVDNVFTGNNYLRPEWRECYELLIDYYRQNQDLKRQLYYIDQLLKADKELEAGFKYLSGKIHKEYDTKKLLRAKSDIEQSSRSGKMMAYMVIGALIFIIILIVLRHQRVKMRDRQKFDELMQHTATVAPKSRKNTDTLDINPDVVASVLRQLEKFEEKKKFLQPDMTLNRLAAMFSSNTKYVSQIIAHYKNKKSNDYINDLRIDHVVGLLKAEKKYRNYSSKAIAAEVGFSTQQHFSRAFRAKTGISLLYFVEELNKKGDA